MEIMSPTLEFLSSLFVSGPRYRLEIHVVLQLEVRRLVKCKKGVKCTRGSAKRSLTRHEEEDRSALIAVAQKGRMAA